MTDSADQTGGQELMNCGDVKTFAVVDLITNSILIPFFLWTWDNINVHSILHLFGLDGMDGRRMQLITLQCTMSSKAMYSVIRVIASSLFFSYFFILIQSQCNAMPYLISKHNLCIFIYEKVLYVHSSCIIVEFFVMSSSLTIRPLLRTTTISV